MSDSSNVGSDQATSYSSTPPGVSQQATNCFEQTSAISSDRHVAGREMNDYLQTVSEDEHPDYLQVIDKHPDYLQVIDNGADYLHIVDNDCFADKNETSCGRLDDVESQSNC